MNTADRSSEEVLATTSGETLLTTYAALTHRIHEAERQPADESVERFLQVAEQIADLRAQRAIIHAEVLRRMARG